MGIQQKLKVESLHKNKKKLMGSDNEMDRKTMHIKTGMQQMHIKDCTNCSIGGQLTTTVLDGHRHQHSLFIRSKTLDHHHRYHQANPITSGYSLTSLSLLIRSRHFWITIFIIRLNPIAFG